MMQKWMVLCGLTAVMLILIGVRRQPNPPIVAEPAEAIHSGLRAPSAVAPLDLREWLGEWRRGVAELPDGVRLAQERRAAMTALVRENPGRAFAESLSWNEWEGLPEEVRAIVERPFSARVDFQRLPICAPREAGVANEFHPHRIVMDGEVYAGFVFGKKAQMTSKEGLAARGFALDEMIVLGDVAFERLAGAELRAAEQIYPRRGARRANGRTILLGGVLHDLATEEEESELHEILVAAESSFHPRSVAMALSALTAGAGTIANFPAAKKEVEIANSTWTETAKKVLALRLSYSSAPTSYSYTVAELTSLMRDASNTVKVMSYGKTWLVPTIVTVNLPGTQGYYESDANGPYAIITDARARLLAMAINRDNYDFVVHAHPGSGGGRFGYAGLGEIGSGNNWLNGNQGNGVAVHEFGHNYGLGHAHFWTGLTGMGPFGRTQADGSQVEHDEYGDRFDVMGSGGLPEAHYGAHGKAALNWIEPKEILNVVTNGIYRIWRFDHPSARTNANAKLALKVIAPGGEEIWVGHRRLYPANTTLARGANLLRADGTGDQSLIDTTPLSKPGGDFGSDRDDAGLAVGKSWTDSVGSIRITTIAAGGGAPLEYLDVQVAFLETGAYSFYTGTDFRTNGLVGTYINSNLRNRAQQDDWRSLSSLGVPGKRVDARLSFTSDGWGARAPLRLTGGTDANWDNFSVQWDGYIVVRRPVRIATKSDDSSRFWIDLNKNGSYSSSGAEFVNNHWGNGQGPTRGDLSGVIPAGTFRIRIQYEEGNGGNYFALNAVELPFQLFTTSARATPGLTASFVPRSLRNYATQNDWRTSQTIAGSRVDPYPAFTINGWGLLSTAGLVPVVNGSDADWEAFSVQWDGVITNSAPIKLATVSDDHSRMWIDLNTNNTFATGSPEFISNGWGGGGQGMKFGSISQVIPPGMYQMRIQYEEGGGGNGFVLTGASQTQADAATLFSALTFSGANFLTTARRIASDFTIQFWIRTSQATGGDLQWTDGMMLADGQSFGVSLGNGRILFGAGDATIRGNYVADNQWHHISARRVQATGALAIHVDGILSASGAGGTGLLDSAVNLYLGARADGSHGYAGAMDLVRIWEYARSDDQILADVHTSRGTRWPDSDPTVKIAQLQPNAVQVYWDPLSTFRILEGAAAINGPFAPLATDQNSTNIANGANPMRFFRVRK